MPRNNMPENWQPPAPAWQAKWLGEDDFVVGYFGIQAESPSLLSQWADSAFTGEHAPLLVERSSFLDSHQVKTYLYTAYWTESSYKKWWALDAHHAWWHARERENEGVGYFREIIAMPHDRFETLNSTTVAHGLSKTANELEGPIEEHGYAGGMRDRILLSDSESLKSEFTHDAKLKSEQSASGKRIVVAPPENMCVIRSGQNWSECDDEQGQYYLSKVHPVLKKGMEFLQRNPKGTGCFSMRFADVNDNHWQTIEQSFGLGYATDIYAFEEWAKSHPTHLAIFDRFMEMVGCYGEKIQLRLWHEVSVLPDSGCEFEYIACHAKTGLLSFC